MTSTGHTARFNWGDGNAWERDFRDPALGGADTTGVDSVVFAHFSSHGFCSTANVFQGYFGSQRDACVWRSDRARFGNTNLDWLAIDCCFSLELSRNLIATWQAAFQGLHQIFGFTNVVSDSSWTGGRGYNFGRRAGANDNLGNSWLDESYSYWANDNPVTFAAGRNSADAFFRRDNERINSGFDSIPANQIGYFAWKWRD
jgi:hypothetical protein